MVIPRNFDILVGGSCHPASRAAAPVPCDDIANPEPACLFLIHGVISPSVCGAAWTNGWRSNVWVVSVAYVGCADSGATGHPCRGGETSHDGGRCLAVV